MLDDTLRTSLASLADAVGWIAEQRGDEAVEHALGRIDAAGPERPSRLTVDLGDQLWDASRYRDLTLRYADGRSQPIDRLVRAGRHQLVIEIDAPVSDSAATLTAIHDPGQLPRALMKALTELADVGLAGHLIDGRLDPAPTDRAGPSTLNDQQRRAVTAVTAPGVQVVWGPPGTGKTRVITEAVSSLAGDGRSVLVLASSAEAVDDAAAGVWHELEPKPGVVLRVGAPSRAEVADHPSLPLNRAAGRNIGALRAELERIDRLLAELEAAPVAVEWRAITQQLARADIDSIQGAWRRVAGVDRISHLGSERARVEGLLTSTAEELVRLRAVAAKVESLMSLDPADVWRRIDDARAADNEASALVERHQRQLDEARSARDAAAGQLAAIPSYRVMERRRAAAELEANEADLAEREAASRAAQEAYQERHSAFCRLRVELLHQLPPECDAEWWTDLQQQLATAVADRERIEARQGELEEELRRLQVEIDEVRAEPPTPLDYQLVEDLAPQVPGLRDRRDELSEQFALLESQRRDLEAQRSEIVDAIDATADVLIGDAVVVAMPISALPTSRAVLGRRFDTVIIDEAGDIELPLLVLAASLASSGVALIGDLVSPGPVIDPRPGLHSLSTERLSPPARHWLTTEPFHHLGLRQPGDVDNERGCVAITRQYRCGKAIESLVNRMVYDHRLWSGPRWRNPVDDGHGELVLVDTSGLASPWALSDQRPGHWPLGVLLAARLVELHHGLTIGLVSPNREQAALLRAMAVDTGRGEQLVAGTVDDLRGHHVDVVVLDLVSGPWGGDGLAAAPAEGDAPAAELRAAAAALTASNGRVYLIVGPEAGDPAAGDPTAGDPTAGDPTAGDPTAGDPAAGLRPLLRELGDRDLTTIEAMSLLDDEQLTGGGPALGLSPSRIGSVVRATPKERFYLRLDELIGQCRQRLDIWSPHYSERRIKTLGRRWGPLAHSGRVNARLLPPRTDQEHQALALLRRTGVIAHHSEDLNERLVIVDGRRVLWGSLDVLSSNRRTATMYELDSPTLARLLRARADGYSG